MNLILTKLVYEDCGRIKELYKSAFPAGERAPIWMLKNKLRAGIADIFVIKEDDKFIGFMYFITLRNIIYLVNFAIYESYRGKGYGSTSLNMFAEKNKDKRIFLLIEQLDEKSSNYKQRLRRHNFYLRNGFHDEPKFIVKQGKNIYNCMYSGGRITAAECEEIFTVSLGRICKALIGMKTIELE